MPKNWNGLMGKFLSATQYGRLISGEVVHFIPGGTRMTPDQMRQYAEIDESHRSYKSVRGPCGVDRVVLARTGGHYWIAPLYIFV